MSAHKSLTKIHVPFNWSYGDAAEREADTSVGATDVGKLARQTDDNSLWMLTGTAPNWVPVTGVTGGQLDGYASNTTVSEHYAQLSQAIAHLTVSTDGYAADSTVSEHYAQFGGAVKAIRDVIDGYATDAELSGLDATFQENKNFWNEAINHLTVAADGYAADSTVSEHYAQFGGAVKAIRDVIDGYATDAELSGLDATFQENKTFWNEAIHHLTVAADGYSGGGGVAESTFQENKNFWNEAIHHLTVAADGYTTAVSSGVAESTFQENKNFWNEAIHHLTVAADGYVDADGYIDLGPSSSLVIDNDGYVMANRSIHTAIGSMYVPSNEAVIIDFSLSNSQFLSLDAITTNCAIDFAGGIAGGTYLLKIQNHATAAKTVTWGEDILFAGGTPTAVTATAAAIDLVSVFYDGANWYASLVQDFSRTS